MPIYGTYRREQAPPAPGSVTASEITQTSFRLSWTSTYHNVQDFLVYFGSEVAVDEIGADARTVLLENLTPGTTYQVQVAARNGGGQTKASMVEVTTATPDEITITQQPQDVSVDEGGAATFTVSGENISSYQWEVNTGSGWAEVPGATGSYLLLSAVASTANGYLYRCVVGNGYTEVTSASATLTVQATGLAAPTGLTAALVAGPAVQLDWTDNASGETGYKIYRDGDWVTPIATIAANSTTYDDSTVSLGESYSYRVAAYDGSSTVFSQIVNITLASPAILFSPTDEYVADGQTARFAVGVDPAAGSPTYQWEYSSNGGTSWSNVPSAGTSATYEVAGDSGTNSGYLYRCQVTTAAGTATSGSATLTSYAAAYLHDTYPTVGDWGFKKSDAGYAGDCCRVKRLSDNAESDFGYSGEDLDVAALESWLAGASGELVTLYDSSGSGMDATIAGGQGPLIAISGTVLTDDKGHVYALGQDKDAYWTVDYTSSPVNPKALSAILCVSLDVEKNRENSSFSASRPFLWLDDAYGWTVTTAGALRYADSTGFEGIGSADLWIDSWLGFRLGDPDNRIYQGLYYLYDTDRQNWRTGRPTSATDLRFTALIGTKFRRLAVFSSDVGTAGLVARTLHADRDYRYGPATNDFNGFGVKTAHEHKIMQMLDQRTAADLAYPMVTASTTTTITVGGVDWSWYPVGRTLAVGTQTFTTAGATYDGSDTTLTVTADASAVAVGTEVLASPHYDQSLTDLETAANLERLWGGDGQPQLRDVLCFPAHYYLPNAGGNQYDLTPTQDAIIDSAQPDTTGLTGGISDDGTNWRVRLLLFDVSTVAERPEFAALTFASISHTHTGNDNRPYVGVKLYADETFDAATVTWNNKPIPLSVKPAYDDLESPDEVEDWAVFDLAAKFRELYDAGASTVLAAVYLVNEQYNRPLTDRAVTLGTPVLQVNERFSIGVEPNGRGFELDNHLGGGDKNQKLEGGHAGAAIYNSSIPLSGGREGNPLKGYAPLAVRALCHNAYNVAMMPALLSGDTDVRVAGGVLHFTGPIMEMVGTLLDEVTRAAIEEQWYWAAYRFRHATIQPYDNANISMKGIEGAADCWAATRSSNTRTRSMLLRSALYWLLGSEDGQIDSEPYDYDENVALLQLWGNVPEGNFGLSSRTPEIDYGGRSNAHLAKATAVVHGESDWAALDEASRRCVELVGALMIDDEENGWVGTAGFSGRTNGKPYPLAQHTDFAYLTWAIKYEEARWMARDLQTGSAKIPLTVAAANSAAAQKINGLAFGPLLDMAFYAGGAGDREFPERFKNVGQAWPSQVWKLPAVAGWHATLKALLDADSTLTYWPGHISKRFSAGVTRIGDRNQYPVIVVQGGTAPDRYKAVFYAPHLRGWNGGAAWGHMEAVQFEGYGPLLCNIKISTKEEYYGSPSADYSARQLHDACDVVGQAADDVWFRFASGRDPASLTTAWDATSSEVTTTTAIEPAFETANNLKADISWVATHRMRPLDSGGADAYDGVRGALDLDYTAGGSGSDSIKQLYLQLPIFVGKSTTNCLLEIDRWTGTQWLPITVRGEWTTATQYLRFRRDKGDGSGYQELFMELDSARAVQLYPVDTVKNGQVTRRLWINLHPDVGVSTTIPSSISMSYNISADIGLSGSAADGEVVTPAPGAQVHEGLMWMLRGYVVWGSTTPGTVTWEYSTDYAGDEGAATWNAIGTAASETGMDEDANYSYNGGTIPAGVTAVRLVVDPSDDTAVTTVRAVTTAATTLYVQDAFTGTDGTDVTAHTPDVDVSGGGWLVGNGSVTLQTNRLGPTTSVPDNGTYARIAIGGGEDYQLQAQVYAPSWNTGAIYYGPWIGGRGKDYNASGVRVALGNAGVAISHKKAGVTSWVHVASGTYVPSAATEYRLVARFLGDGVAWRLLSADGVTEHDKGILWGLPTGFTDPEPCAGFSRRVAGQYIDTLSIWK